MDKFTADPHLSHKNIIDFERTQFKTIDKHDTFIKDLIQSNVKPNDTLYVLGDVGEMSDENINFWKSLPCKTILIRGNHDTQKGKLLRAFDVVSDVPIFYKKRILLSHEPLPVTNETLNVHGHLHGSHLSINNYINLSIHVANYKIWTEKDLEKRLAIQPKIAQRFMFEWYAKNYEFHNKKDDVTFDVFGNIDLNKSRKKQLQNPKLQQKIETMSLKFIQEYPDYKHSNVTSAIEDFMIEKYQDNANFTTKDLKSFIENPFRIYKKNKDKIMTKKLKLCYVKSINELTHELWFSDKEPESIWGDDWNDTPYEHNAGYPSDYTRYDKSKVDFKRYILTGNYIISPSYDYLNSPWSVEQINKQETFWLTNGEFKFYAGCTIDEIVTTLENQGECFELYELIKNNY